MKHTFLIYFLIAVSQSHMVLCPPGDFSGASESGLPG